MPWCGDFDTSSVVRCPVVISIDSTGAPTAITSGSAAVRRSGQNTLAPAGVVVTTSGAQYFVAVFTGSATAYFVASADYDVFWGNGAVGAISIIGYPIASFSLRNRAHLYPTTAARTLDVSAGGEAGLDWANIGGDTTVQNLTNTQISSSQAVASVSGNVGGNVNGSVGSVVGAVGSVTGAVGSVGAGGIAAASFAAGAIDSGAIAATGANEIADALLDRSDAIEVGLTPRQALRLAGAAEAGKLSGAGTATVVIRNAVADSKDRITATVDSSGNRTAITTDVT